MGLLDFDFGKLRPQVKTEVTKKKDHELRLIGKEPLNRSHILFSYNKVTGEIKRAEMQLCDAIDFATREPLFAPKVVVEKDCIYRQALNEKNFRKILKREGVIQ